jgi:hypothetical protein
MAASAVVSTGMGIYKAVQGKKAADAAAEEAEKARVEMEKQKKAFEALDTSNPYLNMENTMEDLTINQQQAEFEKQQAMQNQANIMGQMRGAAGSSGIAALAQSLANQGSLQAQRASASIGAQEAQNQKLERGEASRIQGLEREGDLMSRNMQMGKIDTLMGMAAGDVTNAQAMQAAGNAQMMAGIGDAVSGVGSLVGQGLAARGGVKTTTDAGKTAELPGGGEGGVNDLLGQLGNMGTSANTGGNAEPAYGSPEWQSIYGN